MAFSLLKHIKSPSRSKLIKKLDKTISDLVRTRDEWRCKRCNKKYDPPTNALHCSHYFSRRYLGTRWDLDNLDAMCYGCHRYIEGDKQGWYKEYKLQQLGNEGYEKLEIRAYGITKFSIQDLEMLYKIFQEQLRKVKSP